MRRPAVVLVALLVAVAWSAAPAVARDGAPDVLHDFFGDLDVEIDVDEAALIRVGETVRLHAGQRIDGDVIALNASVRVSSGAEVTGTVVAVGGDVRVTSGGRVENDAVAVNGNVHVSTGGIVEGEAVAVGGRVEQALGGTVEGDAVELALNAELQERLQEALTVAAALAPTFEAGPMAKPSLGVERSRTERRDVASFGDRVSVEPDVRLVGDVAVFGGSLDIAGAIDGDVVVVGGRVRVFTTGEVLGDLATFATTVERDVPLEEFTESAPVAAGRRGPGWWRYRDHAHGPHVERSFALVNLIVLASFGIVVLLFNLLLEPILESADVELNQGIVRALFVGLILEVAIPPLLVLLCVTVVLIPVAVLILLAGALGGTVATGLVSRQLGRRLLGGPGTDGILVRTLAGYLVLVALLVLGQVLLLVNGPPAIAWTVSLLGYFVLLTAMTLGLGAVALSQFGRWSRSAPPPDSGPLAPATG